MKEGLESVDVKFTVEEGERFTYIKIFKNSIEIGQAILQQHEPGETVFLDDIQILESEKNKKFGSRLLDEVCRFLDEHNYACYVRNDIQEDEKMNMYSKRGWTIQRQLFLYRPQKSARDSE